MLVTGLKTGGKASKPLKQKNPKPKSHPYQKNPKHKTNPKPTPNQTKKTHTPKAPLLKE